MSLRKLWQVSPLGCVGFFLLGGVFSALFGMASVYGSEAGLTVPQISAFIATIYLGGMIMQYPIGWLSDRMDRRLLILGAALACSISSALAMFMADAYTTLLIAAFIIGGTSNPLYALLLAYVNDHLEYEDMAAASGGLIFINGIGAILGPIVTGWMMGVVGPEGFFLFLTILGAILAGYAALRMTQSDAVPVDETISYAPVLPTASPVAVEAAQEVFIEAAQEAEAEAEAEAEQERAG